MEVKKVGGRKVYRCRAKIKMDKEKLITALRYIHPEDISKYPKEIRLGSSSLSVCLYLRNTDVLVPIVIIKLTRKRERGIEKGGCIWGGIGQGEI